MPVVTAGTLIKRPEELVEFLAEHIAGSNIPFEYIAKYDEQLFPGYPAVQIVPADYSKELGGTHTFDLTIRADLYVMHGNMTESYVTRTLEDLELATRLINFLESPNLSLGQRLVAGWVESERPGIMPPRSSKSRAIVATRLGYRGTSRARF